MSKILITTFGSLGDLHPYDAIALRLRERGHEVVMGTSPRYRQKIESLGLRFHAVRPDSAWLDDPSRVRRLSHPRWGLLRVGREWLMPAIRESYEDTLAAADDADLLVAMMANYAARLVAEKTGIPWVSALHIPLGFFSVNDPPILDVAPAVSGKLRFLGRHFWGPLFWAGKRASRFMAEPWYRLRSEIGLSSPRDGNPLADSHSPLLVLALFSHLLANKQPDWPQQTVVTGFPFFDRNGEAGLSPALTGFVDEGKPPVVFTRGSAVSGNAGSFYRNSLACAQLLNCRAVLVVGEGNGGHVPAVPLGVMAVEYAPFAKLFPLAAAIVHHGGVGTTGLAMRSGRPMLVVPCAWDQWDNAERAARLGIARTVSSKQFTAARAATELQRLLNEPMYSQRASDVAEQIREENGAESACNALESVLRRTAS